MNFYSHEKNGIYAIFFRIYAFEVNIYAAMRSYPVRFRFGKIP